MNALKNHNINRACFILYLIFPFAFTNAQIISTVAGSSSYGYAGDGGQATVAELKLPICTIFDSSGNLYIADEENNVIRKVNTSGIISTIVGNGISGFGGDGGQATAAQLSYPYAITFDQLGNLYIVDWNNNRIRMVNSAGIITTIAGSTQGYSGDGGQATAAKLSYPTGIAIDLAGNLFIADGGNNVIRKINTSGIISTIAGNGFNAGVSPCSTCYGGDGGQATAAKLNVPNGLSFDAVGNLYIADWGNNRIRKVNTLGNISTIAGNGTGNYSGDGGQATAAEIYIPYGLTFDITGNLYIADGGNNVIRKINTSGIINTIVGTGAGGFSGDGGNATLAELKGPTSVCIDASNNLYISDASNSRIRMVTNANTLDIEQEVFNNNHITIYPNPSNGNINITSANNIDKIKITDMFGQIVSEVTPQITNTALQLTNAGVYFITISSDTKTITKKVIVNK